MAEPVRRVRGTRRQAIVLILTLIFLSAALGSFYYLQLKTGETQTWRDTVRGIPAAVATVSRVGEVVGRGQVPDFQQLSADTEDLGITVKDLREGDPETGTTAVPSSAQAQVKALSDSYDVLKKSVDDVLAGETQLRNTVSNITNTTESVAALLTGYQKVTDRLAQRAGTGPLIALSTTQFIRLNTIGDYARRVLSEGRDAKANAQRVATDVDAFTKDHNRLAREGGETARAAFAEVKAQYDSVQGAVTAMQGDADAIEKLQLAAATLQANAANVIAASKDLEQALIDATEYQKKLPLIVYVAGALAVVMLVVFVVLFLYNVRTSLRDAADRDARQQKAILELLDEITNLADGDLTVDVTVTEDFTGAIADSINYTVGAMRGLVGTINESSVEISTAASSAADTARKMNQASERQAKEVTNVTNAIVASSQQLEKVAGRAEALAQDAQKSVQVAHSGAETVNRTIQNMTSLREQIQDTAKRIKRLGESSQEIGNIIEFINDISEQTNTLALNASIQASMAGEQGRGFAVVADEVQRLAERAASATRQIENLVKTIQADTTEAIVSMERSTANVVAGAKSAEEAGQALTQIESSSNDLARLIQEISAAARGQSAAASKIAGTMQVIRDIAVQTSGSAAQTADAVGNLNTLSEKLRQSVAGFKLPDAKGAPAQAAEPPPPVPELRAA